MNSVDALQRKPPFLPCAPDPDLSALRDRFRQQEDPVCQVVVHYATEFRLSPQEERLLRCAVAGLSDKCAASELGCSRNTVGTYWQRIFTKTGVRPQRQVLAQLLRFGVAGENRGLEAANYLYAVGCRINGQVLVARDYPQRGDASE